MAANIADTEHLPMMPKDIEKKYWFRAKSYGWGWGLPSTWQGWLVFGLFIGLFIALALVFPPVQFPLRFSCGTAALILGLVAICYAKGEPPRWRWGRRDD